MLWVGVGARLVRRWGKWGKWHMGGAMALRGASGGRVMQPKACSFGRRCCPSILAR